MRREVENMLIAANWSLDKEELENFKERLFRYLNENEPWVLLAMCND